MHEFGLRFLEYVLVVYLCDQRMKVSDASRHPWHSCTTRTRVRKINILLMRALRQTHQIKTYICNP